MPNPKGINQYSKGGGAKKDYGVGTKAQRNSPMGKKLAKERAASAKRQRAANKQHEDNKAFKAKFGRNMKPGETWKGY